MCFSANARFGACILLAGVGITAIAKSKTTPQRLFAVIPLLFSIQQLSEGLFWLSLKQPVLADWQSLLMYTFLVFAMVIWPLWIPVSILLLEKDVKRKRIIKILTAIGATMSLAMCFIMLLYPVEVMPLQHHLHYNFIFPLQITNLIWVFTVLYIFATLLPPFVSGIKKMKWLGIGFVASYLFAVIYFHDFVVSVWCYFAAVLSFVVLWIITDLVKTDQAKNPA